MTQYDLHVLDWLIACAMCEYQITLAHLGR